MRKQKTDIGVSSRPMTFVDHTLVEGAIFSTRLHFLADKARLLDVGSEYLAGMRATGEHVGDTLPYTVCRDWPTIYGHKFDFLSGDVNMGPIFFWTVSKDNVDDHVALFIPPYDEPEWATDRLRPDPEMILASLISLSLGTSPWLHPVERRTERIMALTRIISAQRPVLVTVPILPTRMVNGEATLALDILGEEYELHRSQMGLLSVAIASAVMEETAALIAHVYVPHPDVNAGFIPSVFTAEEFLAYHHDHSIPVVGDDDPDPIDGEGNARFGALKAQEVMVDDVLHTLWVVQPGFYSEEYGLELPETED